jgi:hypothetical protein
MPNCIPAIIRKCKRLSTRVEAGLAAAEATRFTVFGCRGLRIIGCLLISGGDAGEDGGREEICGS